MSLDQINEDIGKIIKRDRWGRPLIVPPEGGPPHAYLRSSSIGEILDSRFNLEQWKMRMVALGLADRPDLFMGVKAHGPEDKSELNDLCKQATEAAKARQGANLGTAFHNVTAQADMGRPYHIDFEPQVQQYHTLLEEAGFEVNPAFIERFVVCDERKVAGSFDRLLYYPAQRCHVIGDIKCGGGIDYGQQSFAIQLASYAHGVLYNPADHSRTPLPADTDLNRAVIIHLPSSGEEPWLYWLDIAAGWEAMEHALWTREWRERQVMTAIPRDLTPQAPIEAPPERVVADTPTLKVVKDGELDPAKYRPLLSEFFKEGRTAQSATLYNRWRKEADGALEFDETTVHRYERLRAAWMLAVICGEYFDDDYADQVAAAIIHRALGVHEKVWQLSGSLTQDLHVALTDHNVDIKVVFNDEGLPLYTVSFMEKG